MPEFPHIAVLCITYERPDELVRTITALKKNVVYPTDKLHWIISDDSRAKEGNEETFRKHRQFNALDLKWLSTPANYGWGKHVNWALKQVDTEYIFFIEDDYICEKKLDLRIGVALLETRKNIGMLRYRGTGGSHIVYHAFQSDISGYLPDFQEAGGALPGQVTYMQLDSGSPDLYLYSHGAHLRRQSFTAFYGEYPNGYKMGALEEAYAHHVRDMMKTPNAPALAIMPEWIPNAFNHIGVSRQHTEVDIERK